MVLGNFSAADFLPQIAHAALGVACTDGTHLTPRAHNGSQGQPGFKSTLVSSFYDHRFFFVDCIANFDLGLRDIPIFFSLSINPAGQAPAGWLPIKPCQLPRIG